MIPSILATTLCVCAQQAVNPKVKKVIEDFVESKEIAGAVTVVADRSKMLHVDATGWSDIEGQKEISADSIFWIASMTKPITAVAVMMMQEEGKLSLSDPVSKYLPEFKNLKDAEGHEISITIQQCLTHTTGLADVSQEESKGVTTLAELSPLIIAKPVKFAPDSKWEYCQTGINTAARVVEVVSGKAFPEFLQERLLAPLGMKDTTFYPTSDQLARLAGSYKRTDDGKLEKAEITFLGGKSILDKDRYPRANGGLFSTAADYTRFAQMMLRGGEFEGRRYLKAESVKQMTSVQTGDLVTGFTPGNGWGLGCCIVRQPQGITAALSPGSFGHGGLFGTQAWIDPVKERIYLLFIQRANFANQGGSDASEIRRQFQNAAVEP